MPDRAVRIAIIGAGPSAFYAAAALIKQTDVEVRVDIFDRLFAPYGLVRYGVAPDHPRIKSVAALYEKTAMDERVRFFGCVEFGKHITLDDLRPLYDQVVFATGAQSDRNLNIPGEDLGGSMSATEFVAWYNSHPDYVHLKPNLDVEGVVVVGVGNVAMDVARILAKSYDELKETDIADHALEALKESKVKNIYVLGRRGPAQAKFTNPEIKEFGHLEMADPVVLPAELELDPDSQKAVDGDRLTRQNVEILREYASRGTGDKPRKVHFRFLVSPVEINGNGKVEQVKIERNKLVSTPDGYLNCDGIGEFETLNAGMVLRSVGYYGVALPGVPYNKKKGTIPNDHGRVLNNDGDLLPGAYVVGWAKRGPTGVIGTNKKDAEETVALMLEDVKNLRRVGQPQDVAEFLKTRDCTPVLFDEWQKMNTAEIERGKPGNRPRVKFNTVDESRSALKG
ncbi:MAG: FAD-dependent oxidoreductase [Planctomycetes bacterium]|nr:FAD-dependent oxidoreductase [Planctomycetota bacterium]